MRRASFAWKIARRKLWIDSESPFSLLSMATVEQIEHLAPFGQGNSRPLLIATAVTLAEAPRRIGGGGRHLSVRLVQHGVRLRGVAFGGGDWADDLAAAGPISVAFRPVINDFKGRRTVELHVVDWRSDAAPEPATIGVAALEASGD